MFVQARVQGDECIADAQARTSITPIADTPAAPLPAAATPVPPATNPPGTPPDTRTEMTDGEFTSTLGISDDVAFVGPDFVDGSGPVATASANSTFSSTATAICIGPGCDI